MTSFTEINRGTFGVIFTDDTKPQDETHVSYILKRTIEPNVDPQNWLKQDAFWHGVTTRTWRGISFSKDDAEITLPCVPEYYGTIDDADEWWSSEASGCWESATKDAGQHYNNKYARRASLLSAQRIPNIQYATATRLLGDFAQAHDLQLNLEDEQYHRSINALCRVYFGQDTPSDLSRSSDPDSNGVTDGYSTLRNFPLYRDRLKHLLSDEDRHKALKTLAAGLAFLHWEVKCDGRDVEFVFGGLNTLIDQRMASSFQLYDEDCQMWLLDFNQVQEISMDKDGVEKAVLGYLENDPYYPKPGEDVSIWTVFKDHYLYVSSVIMHSQREKDRVVDTAMQNSLELPSIFIEKVEKRQGENKFQRVLKLGRRDDAEPSRSGLWSWISKVFSMTRQ